MTVALADPEESGPTLADLAAVMMKASEASRLAREVAETLARWGMEATDG